MLERIEENETRTCLVFPLLIQVINQSILIVRVRATASSGAGAIVEVAAYSAVTLATGQEACARGEENDKHVLWSKC